MKKTYTRLLTIAGSDSGGGAGIQADIKTFSALGCYAMSVITALTAQNTVGVQAIESVSPEFIAKQIDAILTDIGVDAIKIGMLSLTEIIDVVAERLQHYQVRDIILDPVMVAKSGDKLLQDSAIESLKEKLIPMSTIITPNLPEAEVLLGRSISESEMELAVKELKKLGATNVLLKGGHNEGTMSTDCLIIESGKVLWYESKRIQTNNTHGTGCTLSSAITSYIGKGFTIENSVAKAKQYISESIQFGTDYEIGKGHGPVHHFYQYWK